MPARPTTIYGLVKVQCAFCQKWMSPLRRDKHGPKCYEKAIKQETK